MTRLMRRMVWMMSGGVVALVASGCATATPASTRPLPALATLGRPSAVLNHIAPARDSMGSSPTHFEWTPVAGADEYAVGVYNEIDMIVWRYDHIPGNVTSIDRTDGGRFEPGTYFWMVSAQKDGLEFGESGLSAFVVRPSTP